MRKSNSPVLIRKIGNVNHVSLAPGWSDADVSAYFDKMLFRDNPTPLETRHAQIPRPATYNEQTRTIEAVLATATPVPRTDVRGQYLEILDVRGLDLEASKGVAVLDSHQQKGLSNVLGTVASLSIERDAAIGSIRLTDRPDAAATVGDIRSGIVNSLSIGYVVHNWRDGTDSAGNRTRTATAWEIREASFVSVPADRNARTRSDDRSELDRQITDMARRAGVDPRPIIERASNIEAARSDIMFEMQLRSAVPISSAHNTRTLDDPANRAAAMGEALYMRVAPSHKPSAAAAQFVGLSIPDLARDCLTRVGLVPIGGSSVSLITRALASTSDFPLVLADVVNRTLRQSYDAATSAVKKLGREQTAPDFRKKHRIMLDSSGMTLEKVTETGEFRRTDKMKDAEETYALDSYGTIFGISRKALVNDDLGAFTDMTRRLGQAAAHFEAQFLVNLLTQNAGLGPKMSDGANLFDVSHGNVAGTGAAMSSDTLSAARLAMRHQTGQTGGLIVVEPLWVLIPAELETSTEKLLTAIRPVVIDNVNIWSKLQIACEPRLTDPARWYLTADPAQIDGLEFSYLAGQPGPQVESRVGFEVDGVEVKVRLDFGAGFVDWRGWYTNKGTA